MPNRSSLARLYVLAFISVAFGAACAVMKPMGNTGVFVTVEDDCTLKVGTKDPVKIRFREYSGSDPLEVVWDFNIPNNWKAQINGWSKQDYIDKKKDAEDVAEMKTKLLGPTYDFPPGQPFQRSDETKIKEFKVKKGWFKYRWPVWEYRITIWDNSDPEKPREVCTSPDPGVCVRGGGGSCERDP